MQALLMSDGCSVARLVFELRRTKRYHTAGPTTETASTCLRQVAVTCC